MQCPECGQGPCPKCGRAYDPYAHPEIDCPWCEIDRAKLEIDRLRKALDVAGWDAFFIRLQLAVRGHEDLINECGERIERVRNAAKGD